MSRRKPMAAAGILGAIAAGSAFAVTQSAWSAVIAGAAAALAAWGVTAWRR